MGLRTMSILTADATIALTGGTAESYVEDGVEIKNGVHLVNTADSDYATRRQITVKNRPPVLDAKTGAYGKDRKSVTLTRPITSNGTIYFELIRIEREVHPTSIPENVAALNHQGVQLLTDPDMAAFWQFGSLA